ncbi:amino acid/amide ABC transporter membrane protein 2, HAAT family [Frankia casuarinae]|uniref:Amino acid/amide ABC transporter membrane protein 2, HAAT family n=1 Tax=Frankia casuarinae (strain DSM 45818 / CECT 9043 / HFP020203 / CcI3) TaxID=106370 RepID=Q2JG62_FRACC|nr:amino acid/amide ABC transporter membrane protein 2, HAAT family [Frankia casuarinae]EYT92973.1 amino acid/amide ABC transporter membrane protein 2, HAAT family [Frankia casuarinae]KDA43322.1 amino acid/amide ABC transporter membrane protein 2, HAAT family [Frankia sp. BMG5.23]TFE30306.1 branched-chain amino acid ABC transporter permease [Frankia sp. B2]
MSAATSSARPPRAGAPLPPAGPGGGSGGDPAGASLRPAVLFSPARLRQLGVLLLVGVLAAVVTGPAGGSDKPLKAFQDSVLDARILPYLGLAAALWIVLALGVELRGAAGRLTAGIRGPVSAAYATRGGPIALNLALLAVAIIAPLVVSTAAQQSMVNDIGIYALLALGLNVVVGYAGLLDLGYIAFFAIGAYATAYFTSQTAMPWHAPFVLNPFFVFPIALVLAALAGVVLGAPTLRLRGDYLAIVTLGFGEIIHLIANNADNITNGARGAFGVPHLSINLLGLGYEWGIDPLPYYYLLLAIIVGVMIAFGRLERSRIGRAWAAIREDEIAAEATGVATLRMKLLAFAIGASVSGFAGVLFASKQFFNPQSFSLQASFFVVAVVIFGGMGSRLGVVVGAVVLQGIAFYLRDKVPPADRYIYFGAVIVIMMIFRPQGLVPSRRRRREIQLAEAGIGAADSLGAAPTGGKP